MATLLCTSRSRAKIRICASGLFPLSTLPGQPTTTPPPGRSHSEENARTQTRSQDEFVCALPIEFVCAPVGCFIASPRCSPTCSCSGARRRMAHCVGTRGLRRTPCRGFTLMLAESHMAIKPAQERDTPAVSLPQLTLSVRLCDYEDCCRPLHKCVRA